MGIRKKKTVRDQLEVRLDEFLNQAEDLRKQVSDRAPEVRDSLITRLDAGLTELKTRWPDIRDEVLDRVPEMSEETYDKLPDGVKDKVPDDVKPKKKNVACASSPSWASSPVPVLRLSPPCGVVPLLRLLLRRRTTRPRGRRRRAPPPRWFPSPRTPGRTTLPARTASRMTPPRPPRRRPRPRRSRTARDESGQRSASVSPERRCANQIGTIDTRISTTATTLTMGA